MSKAFFCAPARALLNFCALRSLQKNKIYLTRAQAHYFARSFSICLSSKKNCGKNLKISYVLLTKL